MLDVFTRPQQPITKSLIDEILPQELPASVLQHVHQLASQLRTTAPGHGASCCACRTGRQRLPAHAVAHGARVGVDMSIPRAGG